MNLATERPKIVVICGPTAVGKTAAAIELARHFGGQIIGADSMQVYKYMDIGTAKPTAAEQARVVHHMIDIVAPDESFDAARYAELAAAKIIELDRHKMMPFVVGGTGLYIKALLHGLFDTEAFDAEIRRRLKQEADARGIESLYERLGRLDPETATRLHPNDRYRIVRALEVVEATGKPISRYHREHGFSEQPFDALKIALNLDRPVLYARIDQRVDAMMAAGLLQEVEGLLARGYAADLKSMQSIGYRHMVDFIQGKASWQTCVQTLKRDHRRYAKRQLTWFGADPQMIWKEPGQMDALKLLIEKFIKSGFKTPSGPSPAE
jgi:tRNA dimethylallyltransferase